MKAYLTSSFTIMDWERDETSILMIDERNDFVANLKADWKDESRILIIASDPDVYTWSEGMKRDLSLLLPRLGMSVDTIAILDHRNSNQATKEWLQSYDVLILSGGHVPTEHRFFEELGLREMLLGYEGLLLSISAGTMNAAKTVYCAPELKGEATDPTFVRYFPGLGITKKQVVPHWQFIRTQSLDGLDYVDITLADSMGHTFYALNDGSYIVVEADGSEKIYGYYERISDGNIEVVNGEAIHCD